MLLFPRFFLFFFGGVAGNVCFFLLSTVHGEGRVQQSRVPFASAEVTRKSITQFKDELEQARCLGLSQLLSA